ncbi:hypothetical protein GGF46_004430 [Coemansia sp. RSA 552]|nr:hypothetical protein GGF46_004430 [Coemansia sp. RSA 552]
MEEQYRQWRLSSIEKAAAARRGAAGSLSGLEQRLTYADFKRAMMEGDDGGRLLEYVNTKVIFQAGVDYESKPMVVFCACNLPDPRQVDYDRLLNLIIFRLDEFVESDYTVVMLTSGAQHSPGWGWLTKAYRRLDRKYRKHVKNVYVVHPSTWIKIIFQVFGKIPMAFSSLLHRIGRGSLSLDEPRTAGSSPVGRRSLDMGVFRRSYDKRVRHRDGGSNNSPKFFAKVAWVDTLSQLAAAVPLSQISVPQPVYE